MKRAIHRWTLRWFVALWVFAGFMMGLGFGLWVFAGAEVAIVGKWVFWTFMAVYFVVSGTLGRGYLQLIRELR